MYFIHCKFKWLCLIPSTKKWKELFSEMYHNYMYYLNNIIDHE